MSDQRLGTITLGREDGDTVTKPIPSSGERIPLIGIGTARERFSAGLPAEDVARRKQVLQEFTSMGGRMLDIFRYGDKDKGSNLLLTVYDLLW